MRSSSSSSGEESPSEGKRYFCNEPWIGVLAVEVDRDVTFCPCYLKLRLGNLRQASLQELWNAEPLVAIRRAFHDGELPEPCRGQLCAPALGTQSALTEVPAADARSPDRGREEPARRRAAARRPRADQA